MFMGSFWNKFVSNQALLYFIRSKDIQKLQNVAAVKQFGKDAEREMILYHYGIEPVLATYIRRYKVFKQEVNLLFIENRAKYPELFAAYCDGLEFMTLWEACNVGGKSQSRELFAHIVIQLLHCDKKAYDRLFLPVVNSGDTLQKLGDSSFFEQFRTYHFITPWVFLLVAEQCPEILGCCTWTEECEDALLLPENLDVLQQFATFAGFKYLHRFTDASVFCRIVEQYSEFLEHCNWTKECEETLLFPKNLRILQQFAKVARFEHKPHLSDTIVFCWIAKRCPEILGGCTWTKECEDALLLSENLDVLQQFAKVARFEYKHHLADAAVFCRIAEQCPEILGCCIWTKECEDALLLPENLDVLQQFVKLVRFKHKHHLADAAVFCRIVEQCPEILGCCTWTKECEDALLLSENLDVLQQFVKLVGFRHKHHFTDSTVFCLIAKRCPEFLGRCTWTKECEDVLLRPENLSALQQFVKYNRFLNIQNEKGFLQILLQMQSKGLQVADDFVKMYGTQICSKLSLQNKVVLFSHNRETLADLLKTDVDIYREFVLPEKQRNREEVADRQELSLAIKALPASRALLLRSEKAFSGVDLSNEEMAALFFLGGDKLRDMYLKEPHQKLVFSLCRYCHEYDTKRSAIDCEKNYNTFMGLFDTSSLADEGLFRLWQRSMSVPRCEGYITLDFHKTIHVREIPLYFDMLYFHYIAGKYN